MYVCLCAGCMKERDLFMNVVVWLDFSFRKNDEEEEESRPLTLAAVVVYSAVRILALSILLLEKYKKQQVLNPCIHT